MATRRALGALFAGLFCCGGEGNDERIKEVQAACESIALDQCGDANCDDWPKYIVAGGCYDKFISFADCWATTEGDICDPNQDPCGRGAPDGDGFLGCFNDYCSPPRGESPCYD